MKNDKQIEVLNDLIRINNDRIEGYEKAAEAAGKFDTDLRSLFLEMKTESSGLAGELEREVINAGGSPAEGATAAGAIYRTWMDVKNLFTGDDRQALLNSCEFGEDAAQKAYKSALEMSADLSPAVVQLITTQKAILKKSHDLIKQQRDMAAAGK